MAALNRISGLKKFFSSHIDKHLSKYEKSDLIIKQKAQVFYYLSIAGIISLVILVITSSFTQEKGVNQQIYLPVLFLELGLLLLFFLSLRVLIRGYYNWATHIFIISANLGIWIVTLVSVGDTLARIDNIVLILAVVSAVPLLISTRVWSILTFVLANIIFFSIFMTTQRTSLSLSEAEIISLISDATIALFFVGVIGYQILRINRKSLEKVESDYQERLGVEKQLVKSELRYRNIFENAQIGIYQTTPEGKILQSNPALVKMLGFDSFEELSKRNTNDPNAYVNSTRKSFTDLIEKQGFVKDFESEWKKKNNDSIIVRLNARAVRDQNGKTKYYEGFVVNITERKKAEKALKESEEKYRTLVEGMNEVLMLVDNDDRVLYINKKFTDILGYTKEEIIGKIGYKKLLDPKDHELIIRENKERTKDIFNQYEMTCISKNGKKIDFLVSGSPVKDSEGNTVGSMGAMTDITELKKNLTALQESEEKYRTIIDAFPDIIMISDVDKNIIFANDMLEKVTGIKHIDYNNPNRKAHIHPEDSLMVEKAIKELLEGNKSHTSIIENRFIDTNSNIHWFSGTVSKVMINGQLVLQTIARDITESKKIEQELEKYRNHLEFLVQERTEELAATNEELTSTNEELLNQREELEAVLTNLKKTRKQLVQSEKMASLGVLASGVAHEINNPLNFIKGGVVGIEQYFDENLRDKKEDVGPLIDGINEGIDRAAKIVKSLNHYSRKSGSKFQKCDMHEIIDNCIVMLQNQTKNRIEVQKAYTEKDHYIEGNEGKLHQVMINVLSNSVQAIKGKGIINIKTQASEKKMVIIVKDTGQGISKENLSKVFDPFFTTKDPGEGTGLGLSITYSILEEHNGTIDIESKVGEGATVIIQLPLNKESDGK